MVQVHSAGMLAEVCVRNPDLLECIRRADKAQGCYIAIASHFWAMIVCIGHVRKTIKYGRNYIQKGSSRMIRSP